jgi:hypothetical protein
MQCSHESPLLLTRNTRRSSMVTLAGLEPATSPAPVNKDALSPLSYSVVVIFMTVYGGARADTCKNAVSGRHGRRLATVGAVVPGLTGRQNFSDKDVLGAVALTRLICTHCRADVESVLRCRRCGALCPTSQIGAALLSPSAFVSYVLVLVVIAIFGLLNVRRPPLPAALDRRAPAGDSLGVNGSVGLLRQ